MDAFTEKILTRARERQRILKEYPANGASQDCTREAQSEPDLTLSKAPHKEETQSEPNIPFKVSQALADKSPGKFTRQNSITRVCSAVKGCSGQQTKTLNIQRDDFNMEIKVNSAENVRVEVEIEEHDSNSSEQDFGLREESKSQLRRLGRLYAGGEEADISSPIHRTEAKFYEALEGDGEKENCNGPQRDVKVKKGLSRLADLANTINQWEDDLSHPSRTIAVDSSSPRKAWKAPQPPPSSPLKPQMRAQKGKVPSPPDTCTNDSPKKVLFSPKTAEGDNQTKSAVPKQLNWDRKVLDTLESQGFTRTQSSSRLVYAYNSQEATPKPSGTQPKHVPKARPQISNDPIQEEEPKTAADSPSKHHIRSTAIANRAAMFEQKTNRSPAKPEKDPALLSLADRKALFEKNKGAALMPKAAFGMSAPVKVDTTMKACESKFIGVTGQKGAVPKGKYQAPPPPKPNAPPTIAVVHQAGGIASKMAALLESKSTISEEQIAAKMKEERQKELDMLLNRFNKNREVGGGAAQSEIRPVIEEVPSSEDDEEEADERTAMIRESKPAAIVATARKSAEKRKSGSRLSSEADSPHVVSVLDEVKRIKVTAPKPGRLYPNLSDIEATTTDLDTRTPTPSNEENSNGNRVQDDYDSDDPNTSFGRDILEAVCKNATPTKRVTYRDDLSSSSSSSSSGNSGVMDELDEILEEMEEDSSSPTPPKLGRHASPKTKRPQQSNSFHYKSFTSSPSGGTGEKFRSPKKSGISPRQSVELPVVVDGDHIMTLTHTVSLYRKQQNEVHTPVRQIVRQPILEEVSENAPSPGEEVRAKIAALKEEVNKQQNIIAQTSQALNLCNSTPEFSGSTEQVEAERVLLVATHRRQAALHEQQRLKVEGAIRPVSEHSQRLPLEKGTLTVSDVVLPLKQKYVTALAAAGGKGHHVVCLIKCGEQVAATKLVSTVASSAKDPDVDLKVPGSVTLEGICSDFAVTFEVYCLQAHEECLPHDIKYHINKKPSKGFTTPKKAKQESRLVRPPKESPGGPHAVRSSSFALMGYVVFPVQAVNKRVWSLNNTPAMSPLEGTVKMRIDCHLAVSIEHRGFLTMFEDVSGFGAWHRRWCLLKGHALSYWKYPEDEKKSTPIDTIDLNGCVTKKVGPVSREICARLHTFLLEREREARPNDKDTLVVVRKGDKTIIRHLLSADTKEERIEWCSKLNAALTGLRMWGQQ